MLPLTFVRFNPQLIPESHRLRFGPSISLRMEIDARRPFVILAPLVSVCYCTLPLTTLCKLGDDERGRDSIPTPERNKTVSLRVGYPSRVV